MSRVYVVNHDNIAGEPFDPERDDLPYHEDIDEYDLRVRLTVYREAHHEAHHEATDESPVIYPSCEPTPTHTRRTKVHFALTKFPAGAVEVAATLAWVQIVSYAELQHTIGGLAPDCGEEIIQLLNCTANTNATHLFSNRYDGQTLMPRCLHWVGKVTEVVERVV